MGANEVVTLIANLGFPICFCLVLFKYIQKREEKHDTERLEQQKQHKEEIDKLSEAVTNNTLIMQKVVDKFDSFTTILQKVMNTLEGE